VTDDFTFSICSGSSKPNRLGFSTIPGSPQEPHEMPSQRNTEPIYSRANNPSPDPLDSRSNMPTIEEHENIVNSEDDDEQTPTPVDDDVQTECKLAIFMSYYGIPNKNVNPVSLIPVTRNSHFHIERFVRLSETQGRMLEASVVSFWNSKRLTNV
jgi:hypothetical protein